MPQEGQAAYYLGSSDAEHERLIRQAIRLAPITESFFREAGIGPGHRVLDVGSGLGDVTMLAARLVGPSGRVIGIERDGRSVVRARARATEAGLENVQFVQTAIADYAGDVVYDAAVGRYILQFLPDPTATLRFVAQHVRPNGVIAFQETSWAPFQALSQHLPLWSATASLARDVAVRFGVNIEMGMALHRVFQDAGLPIPHIRVAIEMGSEPAFTRLLPDSLISVLPHIEQFNVSLDPIGDIGTLRQRLHDEVTSANVVVPWLPLVGAWCRTLPPSQPQNCAERPTM